MINVYADDERFVFADATGYCTDEHNNLEVMAGSKGETPMGLFNKDHWDRVLVGEEHDDGQD